MKFEIKNRWTGAILFSLETESFKMAIEAAIKSNADLRGANLSNANLSGANLYNADLRGANLYNANLYNADLRGANLYNANLSNANLSGANLYNANLSSANLSGANLSNANLSGANLSNADLRGANLTPIRDDIWAVLSSSPSEVPALRKALIEGKINGSSYEGPCACLVGTIANAKGCQYDTLPILKPSASRPAERFFLGISTGATPENNQSSKLALEWIDQWLSNVMGLLETLPNRQNQPELNVPSPDGQE